MATPTNTPGSPELSVVPADVEAPTAPRPMPLLYLEIRRGKTEFPERPVYSRNFLIGSGSDCDLRLGGAGIPEAHSVLVAGADEVRIQWLADAPPLYINGELTQEAGLCEGDEIAIGRFEFIVHRLLEHAVVAKEHKQTKPNIQTNPPLETGTLLNLLAEAKQQEKSAELCDTPASELIAKCEADQEFVEEFEATVRKGEEALLYAAAQRAADLMDDPAGPKIAEPSASEAAPDPIEEEVLEELEQVIEQLSGFSAELEERAKRLADQEATQAEAAELLLDAQKELAAQLNRFQQQVADTHPAEETQPKLRKAA